MVRTLLHALTHARACDADALQHALRMCGGEVVGVESNGEEGVQAVITHRACSEMIANMPMVSHAHKHSCYLAAAAAAVFHAHAVSHTSP